MRGGLRQLEQTVRALKWPANLFPDASEKLAGAWRFRGPLLPLGPCASHRRRAGGVP